ncbi:MAG: hypothetical protein ACXWJD_12570, partial [Burkholderiaceae bacterium]
MAYEATLHVCTVRFVLQMLTNQSNSDAWAKVRAGIIGPSISTISDWGDQLVTPEVQMASQVFARSALHNVMHKIVSALNQALARVWQAQSK